jgi:hypothetical protein
VLQLFDAMALGDQSNILTEVRPVAAGEGSAGPRSTAADDI